MDMFPEEMFDNAFAELVLIHIPPKVIRSYVAEVHRVLKKGGRFACKILGADKYKEQERMTSGRCLRVRFQICF